MAEQTNQEPLSKSALKKLEKEKEKAKKKLEREAKELEEKQSRDATQLDYATQNYGQLPLNQSQERNSKQSQTNQTTTTPKLIHPFSKDFNWADIASLHPERIGERVRIQARVHNSRSQSTTILLQLKKRRKKNIYILISNISLRRQTMLPRTKKSNSHYPNHTLDDPRHGLETNDQICHWHPTRIHRGRRGCRTEADRGRENLLGPLSLPFYLPLPKTLRPTKFRKNKNKNCSQEGEQFVTVGTDTRLDNRVLDLRTPVNQAIFRVQSRVCNLFRRYLDEAGFIEIHTPKIQGAATESGASVFKLAYFEQTAFLAQSPQLAKQMAIAADFERVYEIGPVFRAENSNTYRHMTEFIGLDLEMAIKEHYHEAVDLLDGLFISIFKGLQASSTKEIEIIKSQHPLDDFKFLDKTLRLRHHEAIQILKDNGHDIEFGQDMGTEQERILGKLIKEKVRSLLLSLFRLNIFRFRGCGPDYYIIDKFPLAIRPFYTMPDPVDPTLSNSYDFFMRGEEIISGAQRIHSAGLLMERMREAKIEPGEMKGYLDGFKLACPPHAGGGIGLERVVMLFFGLGNIRRACLFPRDPKRLTP
ncbi:aspartate--tRNA(Asn) ligase [Puccinia sorghi]|uniref:aspartate--tRNA ligase n=1 Tax=Puccinia sorghi TaxID=27349 RepID=A0A0L6UUV7_9BASI|nr:aspartate--tRNA(Asn) ligase [Puccinia sorghi]